MRALSLIALLSVLPASAFAQDASMMQDAPAGAQALNCDATSFEAVRSERTGEILYWRNSTCTAPRSSSGSMMMGGMMDNGMMMDGAMMDSSMMDGAMMDSMSEGSMMN